MVLIHLAWRRDIRVGQWTSGGTETWGLIDLVIDCWPSNSTASLLLYSWVRASWIKFNNCPTGCATVFSLLYFCRPLYMFRLLNIEWHLVEYYFSFIKMMNGTVHYTFIKMMHGPIHTYQDDARSNTHLSGWFTVQYTFIKMMDCPIHIYQDDARSNTHLSRWWTVQYTLIKMMQVQYTFIKMMHGPIHIYQDDARSNTHLSRWCTVQYTFIKKMHGTIHIYQDDAQYNTHLSRWCTVQYTSKNGYLLWEWNRTHTWTVSPKCRLSISKPGGIYRNH